MDLIWLSALTIGLHLCINRSLGHLRGWRRLLQWPSMHLAALVVHFGSVSFPLFTVLKWQADLTGIRPWTIDLALSALAAFAAAVWIRWFTAAKPPRKLNPELTGPRGSGPNHGT